MCYNSVINQSSNVQSELELTGGFVPEARDNILVPPITDAEVAETRGFDASGHIGQAGVADAMDKKFEEAQVLEAQHRQE